MNPKENDKPRISNNIRFADSPYGDDVLIHSLKPNAGVLRPGQPAKSQKPSQEKEKQEMPKNK